jgi:hypothetical protein
MMTDDEICEFIAKRMWEARLDPVGTHATFETVAPAWRELHIRMAKAALTAMRELLFTGGERQ